VTINPIEIWAAPSSRSRIEKDYFDNRFQPFYRTEQIYIKSVGLDKVLITYHDNYNYDSYDYDKCIATIFLHKYPNKIRNI